MHLVVPRDRDSGLGALYCNGILIFDFYAEDPFEAHFSRRNQWPDALEELVSYTGGSFQELSVHQPARRVNHPLDFEEWDGYWPEKLEDVTVCDTEYCEHIK